MKGWEIYDPKGHIYGLNHRCLQGGQVAHTKGRDEVTNHNANKRERPTHLYFYDSNSQKGTKIVDHTWY